MIIIEFHDIDAAPLPTEVERLLFDVLYRDFGVLEGGDWLHARDVGVFACACDEGGGLLGVARLMPAAGDTERQLRQVAVSPDSRRRGAGTVLVHALEDRASREGAREVWLNAREEAFVFYERLGYAFDGDMFTSELTRIPHRRMRKRLHA